MDHSASPKWATSYLGQFQTARSLNRRIVLLSGPTNSGKTHTAMQELMKASSGVYLAPLRLMAIENHDRMTGCGLEAGLVTGDERISPDAKWSSRTIETMSLNTVVDVGIIDEVQMLSDPDRGWAWTQAILGCPARTLYIAGAPEAMDAVVSLLAVVGEVPEIRHFQRKTPLKLMTSPVGLDGLTAGDAVIAFSRKDVLEIVALIGEDRAVPLYGAMTPEVRRRVSQMFRAEDRPILVATDAIGMGLNLPVKRILFSTTTKYDGKKSRDLLPGEIRQIGGRAGRYGLAEKGFVGTIALPGRRASEHLIRSALLVSPPPIRMTVWQAGPSSTMLDRLEGTLRACGWQSPTLLAVLREAMKTINGERGKESPFIYQTTKDQEKVIGIIDHAITSDRYLPASVLFSYLSCPMPLGSAAYGSAAANRMTSWIRRHADGDVIVPDHALLSIPDTLLEQEQNSRILTGYVWLAMKYPDVYVQEADAREALETLNRTIIHALSKPKPAKVRKRDMIATPKRQEHASKSRFKTRSRATRRQVASVAMI